MSRCTILAWQPLLRPPLPDTEPQIEQEALDIPLKALACRNQVTSVAALITSDVPVKSAKVVFTGLTFGSDKIPASAIHPRLVGIVPAPEAGAVTDPLFDVDEFSIQRSACIHISISVPKGIAAGVYKGNMSLIADGNVCASGAIEVEVADVDLPDVKDWEFFLNVWMNPATVARWHNAEIWSDEHFELLRPYVKDLALHGQKTVVAPISYQPWRTQTRDPYPCLISWKKRGDEWEFDFSVFDRYVKLHEEYGINYAIHCYSLINGRDTSQIGYVDLATGEDKLIEPAVGDEEYVDAWGAFLKAFEQHLRRMGWLQKTYLSFDEREAEVMERVFTFLDKHGCAFKTSLAGNTSDELVAKFDDLCLHTGFCERGIAESVPPERSMMGVAQLLDPELCAIDGTCPDQSITTFYVCCGPKFPNTFLFSPLVESRMMPFLALQGGFDGFLRWSYNDWTDDPYNHPEWGKWPTGDVFFVYPGENGPVSSLRWEQLREGIHDYELAMLAAANLQSPDEMVDYEQAIALACRNTDGRTKSIGDIELARRLLIPIAAHGNE